MQADTRPILVLGAGGMLGRMFGVVLAEQGRAHHLLSRATGDITDAAAIRSALETDPPSAVINCAAWTDVDAAEQHEDQATTINGHAVGDLARACEQADALLVNYSTDYVFNGQAQTPYAVDHPRDPLNAYGRSKAVGESLLEASAARWLNVRTSWLYAPWGKNFVLTMAALTADKPTLRVVADQRGRPTSARPLAEHTLGLIDAGITGHTHLTDAGETTWHGLTTAINDHLGHPCDVQPCTTADFPRPAPRPAYSVLDLAPAQTTLGPLPDWRNTLAKMLDGMTG